VKSKFDYLCQLKSVIEGLHKCSACYLRTRLVDQTVDEKIVWVGDVEVFAITGHSEAKHCYAWSSHRGKNDKGEERVFAVLEIPPVDSPQAAVRATIKSDSEL